MPADHIADNAIFPASKMGFGCMRLPLLDKNDPKSIDMPQFEQMVDAFMEAGNTYFDTAFVYHEGESEAALGKALVARYPRESFTIATKCLAWALPNKEAAQECLDVSLKRLGTDYVDYYLLHNVGGKRTAKFDEYGMWDFAQEQKAAGKIRHVGFSIHDDAECLDRLLTAHPEMDFVQLQINYLDWDDPHNEAHRLMEVAEKYGKPVIIMEPARGGKLCTLPEEAASLSCKQSRIRRRPSGRIASAGTSPTSSPCSRACRPSSRRARTLPRTQLTSHLPLPSKKRSTPPSPTCAPWRRSPAPHAAIASRVARLT